jgi:hypothetical protein
LAADRKGIKTVLNYPYQRNRRLLAVGKKAEEARLAVTSDRQMFDDRRTSIPMTKINEDMKRVVEEQRLGFMATVCADGTPNLSPKGLTFVLDDNHLVIGEVRSPGTIANLIIRPTAEINVVDPIARKGFRFKGDCRVYSEGAEFEELVAFLRAKGAKSRIRSVIVMTVAHAQPLVSPAYDLGTPEHEVRKRQLERLHELNKDLANDV